MKGTSYQYVPVTCFTREAKWLGEQILMKDIRFEGLYHRLVIPHVKTKLKIPYFAFGYIDDMILYGCKVHVDIVNNVEMLTVIEQDFDLLKFHPNLDEEPIRYEEFDSRYINVIYERSIRYARLIIENGARPGTLAYKRGVRNEKDVANEWFERQVSRYLSRYFACIEAALGDKYILLRNISIQRLERVIHGETCIFLHRKVTMDLITENRFLKRYAKCTLPYGNSNIGSIWLQHQQSRCYKNAVFDYQLVEERTINLWRGLQVPMLEEVTPKDAQLLIEEIKLCCKNDKSYYTYIINFLASIIQYSLTKTMISLILKELHTKVFTILIKKLKSIFGNYWLESDASRVIAKFNTILAQKLLLFVKHTSEGWTKKIIEDITSLVTDSHLIIEPKHTEATTL